MVAAIIYCDLLCFWPYHFLMFTWGMALKLCVAYQRQIARIARCLSISMILSKLPDFICSNHSKIKFKWVNFPSWPSYDEKLMVARRKKKHKIITFWNATERHLVRAFTIRSNQLKLWLNYKYWPSNFARVLSFFIVCSHLIGVDVLISMQLPANK